MIYFRVFAVESWIFKNEKVVVRTIENLDTESKALWKVVESLKEEIGA